VLPMQRVAQAPAEPAFRDRSGHAPQWIRPHRYRGHDELCARRLLCTDVGSVAAKIVATDPAIPVGTNRRRCARRAGADVPNTLHPRIACRKPIGDICKERLPAADGSDQRRSAASRAFFFLEETASDLDTKSGKSGAPNGAATARPSSTAACAAGAAASSASPSYQYTLVSELIGAICGYWCATLPGAQGMTVMLNAC
jgi:hypothetical protein